jgi:hypothetical protein
MFDRVASQRLRQLAEELGRIGEQPYNPSEEKACQFAKSLSILMRCELARRSHADED